MSKAKIVRDSDGLFYGIRFNCPGCVCAPDGETQESPHQANKPHWTFNGDLDKPVFGPSVLQWHGNEGEKNHRRCHSFVGCNGAQPGQIIFLGDCTHALKGQTVDLPDID